MKHFSSALIAAAVFMGACAARQPVQPQACCAYGTTISDRLLFGRDIQGRDSVTEAQWNDFVRTVIAPTFRNQGWSVYRGQGGWHDPVLGLTLEEGFVLERVHRLDARADSMMNFIARSYITAFQQAAVLRVRMPASETLIEAR